MVDQTSDDLFRKLPDEVLCRIIAFLPSETALETSYISTRWRALWDLATVQQSSSCAILSQVSEFITGFENADPLRRPRQLRLHYDRGKVLLASLAAKNRLKLDFSSEDELNSATRFGLDLKLINHQTESIKLCPSTFFVKTLLLKSVRFVTNESVSSIVSGFHFLERLKIVECEGLESLHVEAASTLVSLTILDCPHLESLHLKCSKLRSFRYRGKLPRIVPEYHFNLADAVLDFRQGLGDNTSLVSSNDFDPILLTIKNAQALTLCSWTFESLIWPSICPLKGNFKFYKMKELRWIGYSEEQCNTDSLVCFLKLCPGLERLFVIIDPASFGQPTSSTCMEGLASTARDIVLDEVEVVKVEGFVNHENEIRLIKETREMLAMEPLVISASDCVGEDLHVESSIPCLNSQTYV